MAPTGWGIRQGLLPAADPAGKPRTARPQMGIDPP